ncbi:cell wall-binding repeat-containing protein [Dehalobacter restrictus]|uniref:Cell wall-binding repeat-containing protein n=1 Tax=Dehalobacter restrictus (strain DSM 9455 / PER-K23) TaxID=871738 RepID=A0ABM5P9G1_DEHRP|nr:cell wall-binding repeat-containing protein [Dehalobacter restrictus]AHF11481.1 hypothetical protein DEHRE_13175 [Dehalobacter restrictus DSM 9455]
MSRTKKIAVLAIIAMVLTLMPAAMFAATADSTRLSGADRIATALDIASAGTWGTTVVLAPADQANLVDALAAAPLAGQENAPILLTFKGSLDAAVKAKIAALGATKVYVVGAISADVAAEVDAMTGVTVEALKGNGRIETAKAVNAKLTSPAGTFIVGFDAIPDALSVASYAAKNKYAIVLANGNGTVASADLVGTTKYIVGGTAKVADIAGVERIAGADRFATNNAVAGKLTFDYSKVYVANGMSLVDALAVAPLAAKANAFVALTNGSSVAANATLISKVTSATTVVAVGGTSAVSDTVKAGVGKETVAPGSTAKVVVSSQPAGGDVYQSSPLNKVLSFQVTAGTSDFTFTSVVAKEYGTAAGDNTDITRAYLLEGNDVLTSAAPIDSQFRLNKSIAVPANTTKTFSIAVDIRNTAGATRTVVMGLEADAFATATANSLASFSAFQGNTFTIKGAALGAFTVTAGANAGATNVNVGANQVVLGDINFASNGTEASLIKTLTLTSTGNDLKNFENFYLYKSATDEKIAVLGTVKDNKVLFDFSASPIEIPKSQTVNYTLKGDILSNGTGTIQFKVANNYDVVATGKNSNSNIPVTGTNVAFSVAAFNVVGSSVELVSSVNSPNTGAKIVATANTAGVIREYLVKSKGEPMTVTDVDVQVTFAGGGNQNAVFGAFYLKDGDTGNIIAGPVAATAVASGSIVSFTDVNWYITASQTKKLQIAATWVANNTGVDCRIDGTGAAVGFVYDLPDSNLTGQALYGAAAIPGSAQAKEFINGGALTVTATIASKSLEAYTIASPLSQTPVGKVVVEAGAEDFTDMKKVKLTATLAGAGAETLDQILANVTLWDGDTQVGDSVQPTAAGTITWTDITGSVMKGSSNKKTFTVKADILSGATAGRTVLLAVAAAGDITGKGDSSKIIVTSTGTPNLSPAALTYGTHAVTIAIDSEATLTGLRSNNTKLIQFKVTNNGGTDVFMNQAGFIDMFVLAGSIDADSDELWILRDASDDTAVTTFTGTDPMDATDDGAAANTVGTAVGGTIVVGDTPATQGVKIAANTTKTYYLGSNLLVQAAGVKDYAKGASMRIDLAPAANWSFTHTTEGTGGTAIIPYFAGRTGKTVSITETAE